ncbi:hypothetical protein ACIQCM_10900 [Pseudarthrobacter sp. NPDC092439]|uniref:hypothetical protein n=1 Tax=unclassified Pseudarthrobacter TaxID=2647000 RepID=UPI003823C9F5
MHTRHAAGFPGHQPRVLSGAGDEEAFETEASPPAVAGPLLLDTATGPESVAASLVRLAAAAAAVMAANIRVPVECGLVVLQPSRPAQILGTSAAAARLLEWELAAQQGPASAVLSGGHPVAALQGNGDLRWPQYAVQMYDAGLASSLAVRLRLDCCREWQDTRAALTFNSRNPRGLALEVIAAARFLAVPAARGLEGVLDGAVRA